MVFELPSVKNKPKTIRPRPLRLCRNPIALAQEWQKRLTEGDCSSPADLARKLGVFRARVTQVLRLLKLARQVLETLIALGDPLASPIVTERNLRSIVSLTGEEQKREVDIIILGGYSQEL